MPPKKNKVDTGPAPAAANKNWESALTAASFEESSWRTSVALVQPERAEEEQITSALVQAVKRPMRKLFSAVSWENVQEKINIFGDPKARKTKDLPAFCEVTEAAKSVLDTGEKITVDMMAKLIKFMLLEIKSIDIQRRSGEQKSVEEAARAKAGGNAATNQKEAKGAAKGKKGAETPTATKNTKLKRRGEEEILIDYIDDEPDDGPQHYILLVGFYQPQIISALDSLGVSVSSVIKLTSENDLQSEVSQDSETEEEDDSSEVRACELRRQRQEELDLFWRDLDPVLDSGSVGSNLNCIAKLNYKVKHLFPRDPDEPEAMPKFSAAVFEDVACLLYSLVDYKRQYNNYISSMKMIQVPIIGKFHQSSQPQSPPPVVQTPKKKNVTEDDLAPREPPPLTTDVDMRYYCDLLARVPAEITSVPLVLHCMLEQVVVSEQNTNPGPVDADQSSDEAEQSLVSFMLSSILSLSLPEEEKKNMMKELGVHSRPMPSKDSSQSVLSRHDERSRRLGWIPASSDLDPISVEADIMKRSLLWTHLTSQFSTCSTQQLTRLQELRYFCSSDDSSSWAEQQWLLQLFVFESLPLTTVDENGCAKSPDPAIPTPWDRPVQFTRMLTNTIKSKKCSDVTLNDLQKTLIRHLGNWNFVEKHSSCVFPQVLDSASKTYSRVDTFHCARDNNVYVVCHNPMSRQRCCKEFWDASLHSDVEFRNYLEYVADTISDWTKREEEKWHIEQEKKELEKNPPKKEPEIKTDSQSSLDSEPYIRGDSLKAWKVEQDRLKEEEELKSQKKDKGGKAAKEAPKPAKDNKKVPQAPVPTLPSSPVTAKEESRDVPQAPEEPAFTGYCLNKRLVKVSGQILSLFPCDGGQVDVEVLRFIQGLSQMKICVKKDGHQLYNYFFQRTNDYDEKQKSVDVNNKGGGSERRASFHAVLSNGIQLSCSLKNVQQAPEMPSEERAQDQEFRCSTAPAFLSLTASLPNGLILQFDHEDKEDGESRSRSLLIRQKKFNSELSSGQTTDVNKTAEFSRLTVSNGTVVKLKRDGSTEILFPDGTVSRSPDSKPIRVAPQASRKEPEPVQEQKGDKKDKKGKDVKQNVQDAEEKLPKSGQISSGSWTTTAPSGLRVVTTEGKHIQAEPIRACVATDPYSGTVMVTREDNVISVRKTDGTVCVDHSDGTRITTFYHEGAPNLLLGEKLVRVEKSELPTITIDHEGRNCEVLFGDGTSLTATNRGLYKVCPRGGGVLHMEAGKVVYSSHQSQEEPDTGTAGQYVVDHTADVLCHVTDQEGNHFQVDGEGLITVTASEAGDSEAESQQTFGFRTHPPRLFVADEDGSAVELLSEQDAEGLLQKSSGDSSVVVLTEPLSRSHGSCSITVLRPAPDTSTRWLLPKREDDIIPINLRSRNWASFPETTKTVPGPALGTTLGCSLELKEKPVPKSIERQNVLESPEVLLTRLMTRHPAACESQRGKLQEKVKDYIGYLMLRQHELEKMQVKRLCSPEEKIRQKHLLSFVLSLNITEDPSSFQETLSLSDSAASLYAQTVRAAAARSDEDLENIQEKLPESDDVQKLESLWGVRLGQRRQELEDQERHRRALRRGVVTYYFHPELLEMPQFVHQDLNLADLTLDFPRMQRFSRESSSESSCSCGLK